MGKIEDIVSEFLPAILQEMAISSAMPEVPSGQQLDGRETKLPDPEMTGVETNEPDDSVYLSLDGSLALPGGSLIYPAGKSGLSTWYVLTQLTANDEGASGYRVEGVLASNLSPESFVDNAFRLILRRPADSQAIADYGIAIKQNFMSRFDVLRRIVSSTEAIDRERTFIIAPESIMDSL